MASTAAKLSSPLYQGSGTSSVSSTNGSKVRNIMIRDVSDSSRAIAWTSRAFS